MKPMIDKKFMFRELEAASNFEVLEALSNIAYKEGVITEKFLEAVLEREKEFPTGLPVKYGVAIPHTDGTYVEEDKLIFATLKNAVPFNEMGGDEQDKVDVSIVIMIAISQGQKHLSVLQALISAIQNENFVTDLKNSENSEEMENIVNKYLAEEEI